MSAARLAAALLALGLLAGCAPALPDSPGLGDSDGLLLDEDGNAIDVSVTKTTTTDLMPPEGWPAYLPFPDLPKGHPVRLYDCFEPSPRQGPDGCRFTVLELNSSEPYPIAYAYRKRLEAAGWEWVSSLDLWENPDVAPWRHIWVRRDTRSITFVVNDWRVSPSG